MEAQLIYITCFAWYFWAYYLPWFVEQNMRHKITGPDYYKLRYLKVKENIQECMGLPLMLFFLFVTIFGDLIENKKLTDEFWIKIFWILGLNGFIGLFDFFVPLKWRYKIVFPILIQVMIQFNFDKGKIRAFAYNFYIGTLSCFSANSINIYAGVQGIEVGQVLIIAGSIFVDDLYHGKNEEQNNKDRIIMIYLLTILVLFTYKSLIKSKLFVGDVFCFTFGTLLVLLKLR